MQPIPRAHPPLTLPSFQVYPILSWCLAERESLAQRAYLANFLMRIEVPPEMLQNEVVAETERRYRELVDEFQEAHKETEALRKGGFSTQEVSGCMV